MSSKRISMVRKALRVATSILALGASMSADAGLFGSGGIRWKEEVLLHDGQKIIVERSQTYGGRHEVGQSVPVKEHVITFKMPGSDKTISWTSEYGEELGRTNFELFALHVVKDTPYLVAVPNLCLAYNKWGRPNPPYVIFKHDGNQWNRIPLDELPAEAKETNLVINNQGEAEILAAQSLVTADLVRKLNDELTQPETKTILREALPGASGNCGEMAGNGKGHWLGMGWFIEQPSLAACLEFCVRKGFDAQHCPCNSIFKGK